MWLCTLDYTEAALDAERRLRERERQRYCPHCGLWRWPGEDEHGGQLTEQQFRALVKRGREAVEALRRQRREPYPVPWDEEGQA